MKKIPVFDVSAVFFAVVFLLLVLLSFNATAQTWAGPGPTPPAPCFGPAGCTPTPPADPEPERQICMGSFGCMPVSYSQSGLFTVATVTLPNGYIVSGISGACMPGWECLGIRYDADRHLLAKLGELHRLLRYVGQ